LRLIEGGANNLPDENSHRAATEIFHLLNFMTKDDLVLTLISGFEAINFNFRCHLPRYLCMCFEKIISSLGLTVIEADMLMDNTLIHLGSKIIGKNGDKH
jgi:Domain of unknown function (DUF4147)